MVILQRGTEGGWGHQTGLTARLFSKTNGTTRAGQPWLPLGILIGSTTTQQQTHTEHAHTHRHTQQTCGNRESVVPAAWSRVVASAATMINWLREAGLCCGGFIFLDEEEEEEEERGEGCLGGFSWQGVRVTEQGGSE